MGIPKLFNIIKKKAPMSITECKIDKYEGKTFMIDTSNKLMQHIIPMFKNEKNITRNDGKLTLHIKAMISIELNLLNNGIAHIHVIDGKAASIKSNTLYERHKVKKKAKLELNRAGTDGTAVISNNRRIKLLKKSYTLDKNDYDDIKKFLDLMGLPYIQATEEADAVCAAIHNNKSVYGVISQDMDILVFGASVLLKDFSSSSEKMIKEINLEIMLKEMEFTKEQFVELCILLGTDYCPHIKGLKPFDIYDIYKRCGSIEKFLQYIENNNNNNNNKGKKYRIHSNFINKWKKAKEYYLRPKLNKDLINNITFEWKEPDFNGLMDFLCGENDFSRKDTKKKLKKIMIMYKHYKNTKKIYSIYGTRWYKVQQNRYYNRYNKYNKREKDSIDFKNLNWNSTGTNTYIPPIVTDNRLNTFNYPHKFKVVNKGLS